MFPARTREELDWDRVNRLNANLDFKNFLRLVREYLQLGKTESAYDEVLKEQKFEDYVRDKDIRGLRECALASTLNKHEN